MDKFGPDEVRPPAPELEAVPLSAGLLGDGSATLPQRFTPDPSDDEVDVASAEVPVGPAHVSQPWLQAQAGVALARRQFDAATPAQQPARGRQMEKAGHILHCIESCENAVKGCVNFIYA